MADELISRQAALSRISAIIKQITPIEESRDMFFHDSGINGAITGALLEVKKLPTIDPASLRAKGEWDAKLMKDIGTYWVYWCSECNKCTFYKHDFCPNCGADMRGEKDG